MNPQLNKVFRKIAKAEKTELASVKVELASVADLKKSVSNLSTQLESNFKKRNAFFKARQDYSKSIDVIESLRKDANKQKLDFAKAAKDLGLSPDSVEEYKDIVFFINKLKEDIKTAKGLLK
jgi:antirestriction protein